jgi:hypothetical protein
MQLLSEAHKHVCAWGHQIKIRLMQENINCTINSTLDKRNFLLLLHKQVGRQDLDTILLSTSINRQLWA